MQELFRSFPAILNEFDLNDEVREALVFAAWRRTAGEMLDERSVPLRFSENRLVLAVADETWRKHLVQLSRQMIFKLNASLGVGVVNFIEFRVDPKEVLRSPGRSRKKPAAGPETPKAVDQDILRSALSIKSDNLRKQFLATANAQLSRKKLGSS